MDGTILKVVTSMKGLGLKVTKDLKWSDHVRYVTAKAHRMIGFIKRNCPEIINKKVLKLFYTSMVRSHLCHASEVWAPQTPMLIIEVEKVQRRASLFICKNNKLSYKERLFILNLIPLIPL